MDRAALHGDLVRLAEGDRDAFHPVFVRLWPLLQSFCARHLPPADAPDAAQEVLIRVFAQAAEFDRGRDVVTWVLTIAAWQVRTVRRRKQRLKEEPAEARPAVADDNATAEAAVLARELDGLLEALPGTDAATLRAWARDERPAVPGATFRKRVERALTRLRARLGVSHASR